MIIERTLAQYLAGEITGLSVFKDDLAFQISPKYPYMLTSLIGNKRTGLGAGINDFRTQTDETKVLYNESAIRFTFRAISTTEFNGNEIASLLVRKCDGILQGLTHMGGITLIDSVSQKSVRIAYAEYQSETDIQTITDKLPPSYQKSISYLFRIVDLFSISTSSTSIESLSVNL